MTKRFKRIAKVVTALAVVGVLCYGALFGAVCYGDRDQIVGSPTAMIILGCQVMPAGHPSMLLKDRLDEGLAYWQEHPEMVVVVSGGQGSNEPTTEARAMADYLIAAGVPETQILLEDESRNTHQNIGYSIQVMEKNGIDVTDNVMIVSNGFHLTRARMLWGRATGTTENLSTLAAPSSHQPSKLAMYIREPLALGKSFVFDHNG